MCLVILKIETYKKSILTIKFILILILMIWTKKWNEKICLLKIPTVCQSQKNHISRNNTNFFTGLLFFEHFFISQYWTVRLYHKKYEFAFFYSDSAIQSLLFLWLAISYRCFWIHIITVFIVQNSLLLLLVHIKKLTLNKYIVAKYDKKKLILINWRKKIIIHFKSGGRSYAQDSSDISL